jgi:uracil-DNA glycosylase family 4
MARRAASAGPSLAALERAIVSCRLCPRLVAHREKVAREKRRAYRDEEYWGRPVPGFGDPAARLLVLGLAPAAHGGNRTGRVFTGDSSGDWLFAALHRHGFASQPTSVAIGDGLRLMDAWVTASARCAPPDNKPTREEFERCRPFVEAELRLLPRVAAVLALGSIAWDTALRILASERGARVPRPRPAFGHLQEVDLGEGVPRLIGSYHPSRQNTQTGRLTRAMFDAAFARARAIVAGSSRAPGRGVSRDAGRW